MPHNTKKLIVSLLGVIASIIFAYIAYTTWYSNNLGSLQERMDLIEAIQQNEEILRVASSSKHIRIKEVGTQGIIAYTYALEAACFKRFIIRKNCTLTELNLSSLRELFNILELNLQDIQRIQWE